MSATHFSLPRNRHTTISRWTTTNAVPALLLLGLFCWGTVGSRHLAKLPHPNTPPQGTRHTSGSVTGSDPKWVYVTSRPMEDQSLEDGFADRNALPSEFAESTYDLELRTTQISPSRSLAVINGMRVTEGMSTEIGGVPVHIKTIASRHVLLSILGEIVRLPLAATTEVDCELSSVTRESSQPVSTTQNDTVHGVSKDFR